jgi:hypothetical protein
MISRFALALAAAAMVCGSAVPAGAEDARIGVDPVGVTVDSDHYRDRDGDRDHDKTVIIKRDHDHGDEDKTVIIGKDRDRERYRD